MAKKKSEKNAEVEQSAKKKPTKRKVGPKGPIQLGMANPMKDEEGKDLFQPTILNMCRYDFTVIQNRLVALLFDALQNDIRLACNNDEPLEQLPLFQTDDDYITIEIPFRQLSVDPRNRKLVQEAISSLAKITIVTPYRDKDGTGKEYTSLCSVRLPDAYARNFKLRINKEIARLLVDVRSFGFFRFTLQVMLQAKRKYTQRLYLQIAAWKRTRKTWSVDVPKLREIVGEVPDSYQEWNMFYRHVILKAEQELQELYEKGVSEFYFKTELHFPGNYKRKMGEPDLVKFHIFLSEKEKQRVLTDAWLQERIMVENDLKMEFGLTEREISRLMKLVRTEDLPLFQKAVSTVVGYVNNPKLRIKDPRSYAFRSLMRTIQQFHEKEESPEGKALPKAKPKARGRKKEDLLQPDLFASQSFQASFEEALKEVVPVKQYARCFERMQVQECVEMPDGKVRITILLPDKETIALWEEAKTLSIIKLCIEQCLGKEFLLNYGICEELT